MEIGAVMGAAPRKDVKRMTSDPGDIIILLGGRTGVTVSAVQPVLPKSTPKLPSKCAEQKYRKGNAPTERKIQRMFRRPEVSRLDQKV